jgi:hypothetical protein
MHPLVSSLFVLFFAIQALFLIPSPYITWGYIFSYIYKYSQEYTTFGFEYIGYNAVGPILIVILVLQLLTILLSIGGYLLGTKGSEKFEGVKRVVQVAMLLFGLFPFFPVMMANLTLVCNSSTGNLLAYANVNCTTVRPFNRD